MHFSFLFEMKTTPQSIPALQRLCGQSRKSGPSGETQTLGLVVPNHAFYQLNYTRIFNFCHDTTASGKNKVFSVCGHSCGQNRFCAVFGNRGKSCKRRCRKALRRFALPRPGYRHAAPKPPALPTAPHPVVLCFLVCFLLIDFLLSIRGASLRNIVAVLRLKRSLRSLFLHLGAMPSSATGGGIPPRPTAPHPVIFIF